MNLHENEELFRTAIDAASQSIDAGGLGIHPLFIEKDYWICRSLALLSNGDNSGRIVFKGGTSLTKAYGIGSRFSEDIDIAVLDAETLSGNQLKNLIRRIAHLMSEGLTEITKPTTSKGSHYHKAYYLYPQVVSTQVGAIRSGEILLEINSFANPYPYQNRIISSFLTDYLLQIGQQSLVEQYDMQPFKLEVLDKKRTLTEKLVSLIRCSLADDYMQEMTAKIRHFYDLYFLSQDTDCARYIQSEDFTFDFKSLLEHDRQQFSKPIGWQQRRIEQSPLITNLHENWDILKGTYLTELPQLAYKDIPDSDTIEAAMSNLMTYIVEI